MFLRLFPLVRHLCAEWYTLPAIRSSGTTRRVLSSVMRATMRVLSSFSRPRPIARYRCSSDVNSSATLIMRRRVLFPFHSWDENNSTFCSGNQHRRRATNEIPYRIIRGFCQKGWGLFLLFSSLFCSFSPVLHIGGFLFPTGFKRGWNISCPECENGAQQ